MRPAPGGLLLALDYDGTLARLRRNPRDAAPSRRRLRRLRALAASGRVRVLIVTGRRDSDLRRLARETGAAVSGEHGLTLRGIGMPWRHPRAGAWSKRAAPLAAAARAAVRCVSGVRVEAKDASVAVHWRDASGVRRNPLALRRLLIALCPAGWSVRPGKATYELRPDPGWDKGRVIELALARLGRGWRALTIGDDETDEEGFRRLGARAWTVRVGGGATAARWRVRGIRGVDALLVSIERHCLASSLRR